MWSLYDELIARAAGVNDRIAYVKQGVNWTMVKTQEGRLGVAATHPTRSGKLLDGTAFKDVPLDAAAQMIKSWDFEKATFGLAAINAVINDDRIQPVAENPDAFLRYQDRCKGKKVAVVGRFAYLEQRLKGLCELYVLERRPCESDYPDAACEYLLGDMDVVFITGCAISNKTMPRLLQLSKNAFTIISGPSTPMDAALFELGADVLCGFCVVDEEKCRMAAENQVNVFASGRMICKEKTAQHE